MTTATSKSGKLTPETDTKPDAEPTVSEKMPEARVLNTANLWVALLCGIFVLGGGILTIAITNDRTDQRSLKTDEKVEKMETAVNRIPVLEVQMSNMTKTTDRIEGDIKDVKRLLEARK